MSRLCNHSGTVEYDPLTGEYYCNRCGDVVPPPERNEDIMEDLEEAE